MDIKISKTDLLRALKLAQGVANHKSTMPMLSNVLLRAEGADRLLVAATNLNVYLTLELKSANASGGGMAIGAKNLFELVSNAPGDDVSIKRADNGWAAIKSGRASYKLVGAPDKDFPKMPDRDATYFDVDAALLREMIDRTLFSVCSDETRFHLNGVLLESDGSTARMVSTDGHRLSKVARALPNGPKVSGVIIPAVGLSDLRKILGTQPGASCKVAIWSPWLHFTHDDASLSVKLIDAQFPPYEQVIPKDNKRIITVDRARLVDSMRRAQLMSSDTRGVKIAATKSGVSITSSDPDRGEVNEELEAEYAGDAISIGFNPKYVAELLAHMSSDQVSVELGSELDPGLIRSLGDDDYIGIVMPMRLS